MEARQAVDITAVAPASNMTRTSPPAFSEPTVTCRSERFGADYGDVSIPCAAANATCGGRNSVASSVTSVEVPTTPYIEPRRRPQCGVRQEALENPGFAIATALQ